MSTGHGYFAKLAYGLLRKCLLPLQAEATNFKFLLAESEGELLRVAIAGLRERLPASWGLDVERAGGPGDAGVDAVARLRASDGQEAVLLLQVKRLINTRDVPVALEGLRRAASSWGSDDEVLPVLVARYLAPATRERIVRDGAGYVDATGNLHLSIERPALWLSDRGEDRDPWRGPGRPRGSLQGPPAARVVRALIDFTPRPTRSPSSPTGPARRAARRTASSTSSRRRGC